MGDFIALLSYQSNVMSGVSEAEIDLQKKVQAVVLTDHETQTAIYRAKTEKYWRLHEQQKQQHQQAWIEELRRPWNAEEMLEYVSSIRAQQIGFNLTIDEHNQKIITALCHYTTGNQVGFETVCRDMYADNEIARNQNWSVDKGILLIGDVGRGKTALMRLFAFNKWASYDMLNCVELASLYASDGPETIDFMSQCRIIPKDARYFFQEQIGRCFDDLGSEEDKVYYGNKTNVMAEILLKRYANRHKFGFNKTHVTTNMTLPDLKSRYGSRVFSRLHEMFNILELTGIDRRK